MLEDLDLEEIIVDLDLEGRMTIYPDPELALNF